MLKAAKPRPGRMPGYGPEPMPALIKCWAVLRFPAGRLLVPLLARGKELPVTTEQAGLLVAVCAVTLLKW